MLCLKELGIITKCTWTLVMLALTLKNDQNLSIFRVNEFYEPSSLTDYRI